MDTDEPAIELKDQTGLINPDLTIGVNVTSAVELKANAGLCSAGVKLHGDGFIVTKNEAKHLGLGKRKGLEKRVRDFRNGRDITGHSRDVMVIDLFGLDSDAVRKDFPEIYQHIVREVKEKKDEDGKIIGRDANNRETYKKNWWIFGEPRVELRDALEGLNRYIATVETSKHRIFQFLDSTILPDNALWAVAIDDALYLGILSSKLNLVWTLACGGTLEDRPKFTKTTCFDPFPFPDSIKNDLKVKIRRAAEELDATRKKALAEHPDLTLTELYNVLEALKSNKTLTADEEDICKRGRVIILKELHEKLDALAFDAYGWPHDLSDEQILERLVALNKERAEEEKNGTVRWLRPDYQIPKFGAAGKKPRQLEATLVVEEAEAQKPMFPKTDVERTAAVFSALLSTRAHTIDAETLASTFSQGKKVEKQVQSTLMALARMGHLSTADGGKTFAMRRAG